jgi:succinate dehydrogenase / fumarate reductase flavoprotein subunit
METTVTRLLVSDGRIAGAFGYERTSGKFILFRARAVIVATGGWGRMYRFTSNSWESTGDGAAMALEAGAELIDMEMIQFHPTGMLWPPSMRGILVTEAVRGEGGILRNGRGERFMFDPAYMPARYRGKFAESEEEAAEWLEGKPQSRRPPELLPRDEVSRAVYLEVKQGRGTEHGGVYLDVSHRGAAYVRRKLPAMCDQFLHLGGVDITREPMEVYPTVHYTMGGIRVEPETCATRIGGLFAAGECAGGLHGANRLGGNSLTDILVFGKRAGDAAATYVDGAASADVDETAIEHEQRVLLEPLGHTEGDSPAQITAELQEAMQADAMIERNEEGLTRCLDKILELKPRSQNVSASGGRTYNPGWHAARDIKFQLILSEAIVRSALERKESRGAQWRVDYPATDADWGTKNVVVTMEEGELTVGTVPLPGMSPELETIMQETA